MKQSNNKLIYHTLLQLTSIHEYMYLSIISIIWFSVYPLRAIPFEYLYSV